MKYLLFFLSLTAVFHIHAAALGRFDSVSGNWHVKTDHFACTFLEGSMFPGEFRFSNGKTPGIILFRDTATGKDGKTYALYEERRAETQIIRNDKTHFIIERTGGFFRNSSPVITPLQGVKVTCRYEFEKNSSAVRLRITYRKTKETICTINSGLRLVWYYTNPFTTLSAGGKTENFVLSGNKKIRFWDVPRQLTLAGKEAEVTLQAPRAIASLSRDRNYPCSLNGGRWQYQWRKEDTLTDEAVLLLKAK
ncbi:MAG: hypothetical protein IKC65_07745 [Lentisphaeria bacterium]|nr:hypothetical protein [Lentisphaeria bacterium]